jgi:Ras family protein T1
MTTFENPGTTLEYLAYLGFEMDGKGTTPALKVTKPRKARNKPGRVERSVFLCYVLGAPGSGKSALLNSFLNRPLNSSYHPTIKPQTAVNSVELPGGKQCYLILEELGELEPAILENQVKLDACDLLCFAYDSSDPDSFAYILDIRKRYPNIDAIPAVYAALKADKDSAVQRTEHQPDVFCEQQKIPKPHHVSVGWASISEFFVHLAESATFPSQAFPKTEESKTDRTGLYIALGGSLCTAIALVWVWKRSMLSNA